MRHTLKKLWYKSIIYQATHVSPEKVIEISERKAVAAFNRASHSVAYYRNYLRAHGLEGRTLWSIDEFKSIVPIIDKNTIYNQDETPRHLFNRANIDRIQSILLSSGSSGMFSFGLSSQKEAKANTAFL